MWVVWSYGGGDIVLRGYDTRTLAQIASVPVPAAGGVAPSGLFQLLVYDVATGSQASSSQLSVGGAGNLVATDGGVWGTTGTGMSQWVWFAPGGDLTRSFRVSQGAGAG